VLLIIPFHLSDRGSVEGLVFVGYVDLLLAKAKYIISLRISHCHHGFSLISTITNADEGALANDFC